jgi:hypothetical protein
VVPKPRVELGTRGFSVRQDFCIEILTYLAAAGQAASQLLLSIQQDGHKKKNTPENLANFSTLSGRFSALHEVPLEQV